MRRGTLCLLTLASALPAAARANPGPPPPRAPEPVTELPARFACVITRDSEVGQIGVQRSVDPETGEADEPIFSWSTRIGTSAIALDASWSAVPRGYSLIQLAYLNPDPRRTYRIRVQRRPLPSSGPTEMQFEGPLTPTIHGFVSIWTEWGPLTGTLLGAPDPHLMVLDGAGTVLVDEVVDPEMFVRAHDLAERLRPDVDTLVADYRNRCQFHDRGPVSIPSD